jgi:phosphoglycolate phosphatase-like HAD superfamily hydrolase
MIYIFDIDGTLADISHRLHFIQQKPADWREFFSQCGDDAPIEDVIELARKLAETSELIYVTGRSDECRAETVAWLKAHKVPTWARKVYMRKAGDHRPDHLVKAELLDELIADWKVPTHFQIAGVFEDRKQVVDMYRAKGLRVFQVADGNF